MTPTAQRLFFVISACLLWTGLSLPGCGYRLAGGGNLPEGVSTVCITIFENRSSETAIVNQLTSDLVYEFTRNGQKVVNDPAKAQAVFGGVVKSVSVESVSSASNQTTLEGRVIMVADVVMRNPDGEDIWSADNIRERQAYVTNRDNKQDDDQNRQAAIKKLSRRFAETVYGRLTENF